IQLNELLSGHSSRLDIFLHPKMLRYQSCECPHRLSDKLLKSSATIFGGAGCAYYAFPLRSQVFISYFTPPDGPVCKPLCRVSGGAV
ncbi:hypothetical protein MUA03_16145, partial [Enterobacteriaceae bacterium H16N7]|nr:hypothetical protein [Dryocola clanedunensis]